jgi:two-component system response regulator LytT
VHIWPMRLLKQIGFWLAASLLMAALYMGALGSYFNAFVLAILLLPGAVLLAFLIDRFRNESGWRKWLHMGYALLISLYAEWMGLIVAYWFLFELRLERIPKLMVNPVFLWLWMLFFVFLRDRLFGAGKEPFEKPELFEITSDRKKMRINLSEVLFIESADEICTIHLQGTKLKTRERISQLADRLPPTFLRTHRSFIVNTLAVSGQEKNAVLVGKMEIPVSRKYKQVVGQFFNTEGSI